MKLTEQNKQIFAERLKDLRLKKNMTQLNLAMQIDISQETISSIECGKSLPKLSHLIAICNVFNCSMDYMMGFSEIKNISIPANSLNSYQQILIENFNRCDKTGRNSLLILSSVLSNKEIDIEIVDGITIIKNNISN